MKAICVGESGGVVIRDVPLPERPADGHLIIQMAMTRDHRRNGFEDLGWRFSFLGHLAVYQKQRLEKSAAGVAWLPEQSALNFNRDGHCVTQSHQSLPGDLNLFGSGVDLASRSAEELLGFKNSDRL